MGNLWSRFRNKDVRIILLGLDSAGKTTILYRLKLDDLVTTIPTIGFNVESIQYKDLQLTAWDIGSRDKIRPLFRHYYKGADAVVFVIDSHDPERLDELNHDVIKPAINAEELTSAVFLFLANKMDLPNTMTPEEISDKLGLRYLKHPWGILPVSAVSGDGLHAALDWLAVRLGSAQVRARQFTQPPSVVLSHQHSNTGSSLSSTASSSVITSRTDTPRGVKVPKQSPLILVNSKLYESETRAPSSTSSCSAGNTSSMSTSLSPASSSGTHYVRRTTPTVLNSFSSYSISQAMRDDTTRRKLSTISRSDIRKLSSGSLMFDAPNSRKLSSVSMMDSPTNARLHAKNGRKHSSASLLIDSPCYFRKLSTLSLSDAPLSMRKLSSVSLTEPAQEKTNPNFLSADTAATFTPPIAKRQGSEASLAGFGSFSPIMADYVGYTPDRKDSDASIDSNPIVSPSEHIQPHLRALGLKKSPFLSSSGKYVVNSTDSSHQSLEYDNLSYLLPERYRNLCLAAESLSTGHANNINHFSSQALTAQQKLRDIDRTNGNTDPDPRVPQKPKSVINNRKKHSIFSRGKPSRQSSSQQDSDTSSPSSSNGKNSNLDLFCSPTRKSSPTTMTTPTSPEQRKNHSRALVPASSCSRAYNAIKCLFFRPTRREMKQETDSVSSEEGACQEDGNNNEEH